MAIALLAQVNNYCSDPYVLEVANLAKNDCGTCCCCCCCNDDSSAVSDSGADTKNSCCG